MSDTPEHPEEPSSDAIAVDQLRGLQRLTSRLSARLALLDVASVTLMGAIRLLNASAANICYVEGDELIVLHTFGFSDESLKGWRNIPLDSRVPLADSVQTRSPVWIESPEMRTAMYPELRDWRGRAWAAIPLLTSSRVLGALGLVFAAPRIFTPQDRSFILAVAGECATALGRAHSIAASPTVTDGVRRVEDERELVTYVKGVVAALQVLGPRPREDVLGMLRGLKLAEPDAVAAIALGILDGLLIDDGTALRPGA